MPAPSPSRRPAALALLLMALTVLRRQGLALGLEPECPAPGRSNGPANRSSGTAAPDFTAPSQRPKDPANATAGAAAGGCWPDATVGFPIGDLWAYYFDCDTLLAAGPRPVHDEATWMLLRGAYQGVVGPQRSSLRQPVAAGHGFAVDVAVRQTPRMGRGVFAAQDIRKGELVYTSTKQMARFTSGDDFRRFLQAIPRDLACDVMMWAYVENLKGSGLVIGLDLDEGSFFNDGETQGNVGCDEAAARGQPHGCELNYFALRDIKAGEEMLCVYADFDVQDGWRQFGL